MWNNLHKICIFLLLLDDILKAPAECAARGPSQIWRRCSADRRPSLFGADWSSSAGKCSQTRACSAFPPPTDRDLSKQWKIFINLKIFAQFALLPAATLTAATSGPASGITVLGFGPGQVSSSLVAKKRHLSLWNLHIFIQHPNGACVSLFFSLANNWLPSSVSGSWSTFRSRQPPRQPGPASPPAPDCTKRRNP